MDPDQKIFDDIQLAPLFFPPEQTVVGIDGTTENTETPVENTDPQQIQNTHMETQDGTSNVINEVKKPPPPIFIREQKLWPEINETLKNLGIRSIKNYNTRDGIRMMLPDMETYD
ncbi:hypothetical protein JTB14_038018 [Gonioctena quinquepunctata]|nr:hypothetical protein JTB14_038018 [Gonioctena quinquepunctata]